MADTLVIDTTQLTVRVNRLAAFAQGGFARAVVPAVNEALAVGQTEVVRLISGPVLRRRTGNAAASVRPIPAQAQGDTVTGSVGSNVRYLHFLYKGGTIRPRNAKYLAIPIGNALTPAGVSRYSSPRDAGKLIFIISRAGNKLLVRKRVDGDLDPLFVLKSQVTIPPHDFLTEPKRKMTVELRRSIPSALKRVAV
jgi:hypothetical protein